MRGRTYAEQFKAVDMPRGPPWCPRSLPDLLTNIMGLKGHPWVIKLPEKRKSRNRHDIMLIDMYLSVKDVLHTVHL